MMPRSNTARPALEGRGGIQAAMAFLLLLAPTLLRAHATLVSSSPAPSARLERAPQRLELVFNERIESVYHSLLIVDAEGVDLSTGEPTVADGGETLAVPLPAVPPGRYAVYWRINSLDGHQVQGYFGFGVAADPPSEAELVAWRPLPKPAVPNWYFPLLKLFSLLALAAWLGALAPYAAGAAASLAGNEQVLHGKFLRRLARRALMAGAAYLVLELLSLAGKTAAFTGQPLAGVPALKLLSATVSGSSFGQWWALRFAAAVALLIVTLLVRRKGGSAVAAALGWLLGGIIVISIAATGHAQAATGSLALARLMDTGHLLASLVWAGGLLHLGLSVGEAVDALPDDGAAANWLSWIVPRFSRMAQVAMAVIVMTGVYNTWLHVPSWQAFAITNYGRALLGKLFWVALTLAVAFINWRKVLPELARLRVDAAGAGKWTQRFPSLLQAELAGCVVIFSTVAMLTSMAPAAADPAAGPREFRKNSGSGEVVLRIEPGRLGANRVHVQLLDAAGQPSAGTRRVMVYLRMIDMEMGLTTVEMQPQPAGGFAADTVLAMSGRWQVSVEVTPGAGDAFVVQFDVTIL